MLKTNEGKIVPLKSVNCHVDIKERVAGLTYEQHFLNEENTPIEAVYVFPTPAEASVFSFEARLDDGRVVTGICKEKEQAKKEYNQAISEGNTAYYMDRNDEGKSFRVCIGNLAPLTGVQIKIKLVCELDNEEDSKKVRLNIPTTMGSSYTPQYQYASRSFNPSTANPPKTTKKPYSMNITGDVTMGSKLVSIEAKTHKVKISNWDSVKHSAHFEILDLEELDSDVVLTIERESSESTAFTQEITTTLKNPVLRFCTAVNLLPNFSRLPKVNINDCQYVLCLDVSGSMQGASIKICKQAAQNFVAFIPNGASFRLYTFNTSFEEFKCAEEDIVKRKQAASDWIEKIQANGGTELLPVLKEIYTNVDKKKNTVIIVLSDGDISNTADVFRLVKQNSNATVFTVSIGSSVSQDLIRGLAKHGGGHAEFIGEGDKDIVKVVRTQLKLSQDTLRKHQNDYKVEFDTMGGRFKNVPSVFAPLYESIDNTMYIFSEFEPAVIRFTTYEGEDVNNRTETLQPIFPIKVENSEITMHRIAGIKLINELSAQEKSKADKPRGSMMRDMQVDTDQDSALKQEIIDVSTDLNVLSSYTAFIGVENRVDKLTGKMELREVPLQLAKKERYSDSMLESACMMQCSSMSSRSVPKSSSSRSAKSSSLKSMSFSNSRSDIKEIKESAKINKSMSRSKSNFDSDEEEEDGGDLDFGFGDSQGFMSTVSNYFSSMIAGNGDKGDKGDKGNTGPTGTSSTKPISTKPSLTAVLTINKTLNALKLGGGLLTGTQNGSLIDLLTKLNGTMIVRDVKITVGSIIQLTGESVASLNGYYEIVSLGSADEPWILQYIQ